MPLARTEGVTLQYETQGDGEPVLFIHGALIADAFLPLFAEPALNGNQLIAYHRRGYNGSSAVSGKLSVGEQAADCRGLMRQLGIPLAHVVGHSFGGAVALQLALDSPEFVHTLALLEPALMIGESGPAYRRSLEAGIQHFRETEASVVVDEMLSARWPEYRARMDDLLPGAFDMAVTDAGASFETELPGLLEWDFDEKCARHITQPVLGVLGEESPPLSPRFAEVQQWLQDTLHNFEGYTLPGAHHFLQVENPQEMAAALASFFQRHPLPD